MGERPWQHLCGMLPFSRPAHLPGRQLCPNWRQRGLAEPCRLCLPQVEELSKKLADFDQTNKMQQQKLKVGQRGMGPASACLRVRRGEGRCFPAPRAVAGVWAKRPA